MFEALCFLLKLWFLFAGLCSQKAMSAPLRVAPQALVRLLAAVEEERHWSVPERTLVPDGSSPASRDRRHPGGPRGAGLWSPLLQ